MRDSLDGLTMRHGRPNNPRLLAGRVAALLLALLAAGCTDTLDAGRSMPHGLLPVDERNPVVLLNDGAYDNWQGEYALLLANGGGLQLVGIIVVTSPPRPTIEDNIAGWRGLVAAARASGMRNVPSPRSSVGSALKRPASGDMDETVPNDSEGAQFIIDASKTYSLPYRPLVVLTGGPLTAVAEAYLKDHAGVDRGVSVSSLGTHTASGAAMGAPNGEMDPWADAIVAAKFRYIQVSAFYDQATDVPAERLTELSDGNAFKAWIAAKQPSIYGLAKAADQVAVAAVGIPSFVLRADRVSPTGSVAAGATTGPALAQNPTGAGWLVTESAGAAATARFWELLADPKTFQP